MIDQRELQNRSRQILREAESGEQFLITVEGQPVALLSPCPKRRWVPREEVLELLRANKSDPDRAAFDRVLAKVPAGPPDSWDRWDAE
jgi:prevent-host-death family protein